MSKKILAYASRGGHWVQLKRIIDGSDFKLTTISTLGNDEADYIVPDFSRSTWYRFLGVLISISKIVFRNNPDIVITTGAAPGVIIALLYRVKGTKVIWIDSIANSKKLSLSARIVRPFVTVVLTQWEYLADESKNILYKGAVF
ncbi:hypothetical protein AltI4_33540 [Alteromonas sp. I4]|nr:hypothetical protein AltI4_33540 [Alteromonas sp. I4]